MQAVLPDQLEEVTLADLIEGEEVWVVPWAMYADREGLLFLNGKYTFDLDFQEGRTPTMKVAKTSDGYEVDVSLCRDGKWNRGETCYVGGALPIPVAKIIGFNP